MFHLKKSLLTEVLFIRNNSIGSKTITNNCQRSDTERYHSKHYHKWPERWKMSKNDTTGPDLKEKKTVLQSTLRPSHQLMHPIKNLEHQFSNTMISVPLNRHYHSLNIAVDLVAKSSATKKSKSLICRNEHDVSYSSYQQDLLEKNIRHSFKKLKVAFRDGHTCFLAQCPRNKRSKSAKSDALYVNKNTGYFECLTCNHHGNWKDLENNLKLSQADPKKRSGKCFQNVQPLEEDISNKIEMLEILERSRKVSDINELVLQEILQAHELVMLTARTLDKYNVRMNVDDATIVLSTYDMHGNLNGVKVVYPFIYEKQNESHRDSNSRTNKDSSTESDTYVKKRVTKTTPRVDYFGLFGSEVCDSSDAEVILTSCEFDAMLIHQETDRPVLALPRYINTLPQQALPQLEQFNKIILWLGSDILTWEATKRFCRKLNENRCHVVRPRDNVQTAMTALQEGRSLEDILKKSHPIAHKAITSFYSLKHDIYNEFINPLDTAGVKWRRFPKLNSLLQGHRMGELTIITGPTGSGKTTFMSEYSLDLCEQGVNTLWGSFEINNVRLVKLMLTQFARRDLTKEMQHFDYWSDKFETLPMYFMKFHGQELITNVLEAMAHAVYIHDIGHVIVDNLQFMMGVSGRNNAPAYDRFVHQDQLIASFRKFATAKNCHVTLVIHPRKERESEELTVSSIFGGAKATQEADNVLILQQRKLAERHHKKFLEVAKNRFTGDLGRMLLKFNKETKSFERLSMKPQRSSHVVTHGGSVLTSTDNIYIERNDSDYSDDDISDDEYDSEDE